MSTQDNRIVRATAPERVNHWLVAILFVLAALGGLALFHPFFFWFTNLFGSPTWARIAHPFIGALLFFVFLRLAARWAGDCRLTDDDRQWLRQIYDVIGKHEEKLPEAGRFNAGQKCLFWFQLLALCLLLVTGVVIWRPWFAPSFSIPIIRVAVVAHGVTAFLFIAAILVHIYAAFWVKGSIRGMTTGWVTRAWAKKFHPGWYRQVSGGK